MNTKKEPAVYPWAIATIAISIFNLIAGYGSMWIWIIFLSLAIVGSMSLYWWENL